MSWNVSWDERQRTWCAVCAFRAYSRDISAASALGAVQRSSLIRGLRVRAPDAPPILTCGFSPEHDLESQQSWNDHSFHDWLSARSLTADHGDAERLPAVTAIASSSSASTGTCSRRAQATGASSSSSCRAVASRLYVSMVGLLRPRSILLISDWAMPECSASSFWLQCSECRRSIS